MIADVIGAAAAIAVMALGSAFQASVGIGLALFVVPALALIDPSYIPGPMLLAGSVLAASTAWRERHALDRPGLSLALVGLVVGTLAGATLLKAMHGPALPKLFGLLVLIAVLISIFGPPLKATKIALSSAGAAAGIMGTMVGIHGPPIALLFQRAEPAVARAMLGAFFAVAYLFSVAALAIVGLFGWREVWLAVILLPGVALGMLAAPHLAPLIDRDRLRWAILAISTISALLLLAR
jgi:uncharacterized protein